MLLILVRIRILILQRRQFPHKLLRLRIPIHDPLQAQRRPLLQILVMAIVHAAVEKRENTVVVHDLFLDGFCPWAGWAAAGL